MLRHLVLWKLKPEADGHTAAENGLILKHRLLALHQAIPEIKAMKVALNMPRSAYANYDAVLDLFFDDYQALERYQTHPKHAELARWIATIREERASVDYETED